MCGKDEVCEWGWEEGGGLVIPVFSTGLGRAGGWYGFVFVILDHGTRYRLLQ